MSMWMKKIISAEGVTEYLPGPHLDLLEARFGGSGAVMLLLDVSGSMSIREGGTGKLGKRRLELAQQGCAAFLEDAVGGGYAAGLLLWNHEVESSVAPDADGKAALRLLNRAQATGGTNIGPALELAGKQLLALDVQDRVIAVFGDGELGIDAKTARQMAAGLAAQGIRIITLGLGEASAKSLSVIATDASEASATTTSTMSSDIQGLARGLSRKKR